jgi:uncharacterized protein YdiU (UPF0061 family)
MNMPLASLTLEALQFDNRFTAQLPADPSADNSRRQVHGACYSRVLPTPVREPRLIAHSREVAESLGLDEAACLSRLFTEVFVGNHLLPGMDSFAMCYGGHQFGNWAGQLGDGRAINLGEAVARDGKRLTLQLKGAGPTPYSRRADGLAVLRSSVREFLCSEAMHHLGIPTTRALSLIATGEEVERDMFYDGHPKMEPGAVVCRVAPSFLRFGNYEIFASRGDFETLRRLVDYTIGSDFPELGAPTVDTSIHWFVEVCRRTAMLIVEWMRVGFVHGVMNTDNMSILGLTIDYGPYGWLEGFEPGWTPNTTDSHGKRYCYNNQPHIGQWNLLQLANAIYPLIGRAEPLQEAVTEYNQLFLAGWNEMMAKKLGFALAGGEEDRLVKELLQLLPMVETDMTIFFRTLADLDPSLPLADGPLLPPLLAQAYYRPEQVNDAYRSAMNGWLRHYLHRVQQSGGSGEERRRRMNRVNPRYVLRNYLAQQAIDLAENGDFSMTRELLDTLRHPYDEQPHRHHLAAKRPEWARHKAGCSMLSCSS